MKNFIFLPLIALIFLCSCKSNSFMTQHYTNLGHSHKASKKETGIAKNNKGPKVLKNQEVIVYPGIIEEPVITAAAIPSASKSSQELKKNFFPKRLVSPLLNSGNKVCYSLKSEVKNSNSENSVTKKTVKEKLHHAAGLFDTLFKIVLFSIILAILVAIIIIIILT